MANVFDTAKYILEKTGPMSAQKLQRLCYYAQAWYLTWDWEPLFDEDFLAWQTGPVCQELYEKTKGKFKACVDDETGGDGNLTDHQKASIDLVLEHYAGHSAQWLSQMALMEDPWRLAREGVPPDANSANVITKRSMAEYYISL